MKYTQRSYNFQQCSSLKPHKRKVVDTSRYQCVGVSWNKIAGFPTLFNPPHLKRVAVALPLPRRGCTFKWFVKNSVHLARHHVIQLRIVFKTVISDMIRYYPVYRFHKLIFFWGAQIKQSIKMTLFLKVQYLFSKIFILLTPRDYVSNKRHGWKIHPSPIIT